jgi:hypothetical protein
MRLSKKGYKKDLKCNTGGNGRIYKRIRESQTKKRSLPGFYISWHLFEIVFQMNFAPLSSSENEKNG